jgi:hypothetical protein
MYGWRDSEWWGMGGLPFGLGDLTSDIASAIAQMEGYNTPGTLAARNNNPGNLRSGPGQTGTSGGFAVFPDPQTGWNALDNQVQLNIGRGLTLQQFFAGGNGYPGYAPSADSNNPTQYAAFVGTRAGIPTDVPLTSLESGASTPASYSTIDPTASGDASSSGFDLSSLDSSVINSGGISPLAWAGIAAAGLGLLWVVS